MFPVYRYMDPYPQTFPYQREPNSYPCHYYPSWEAMPPQMKVDLLKHPSVFGPSPFNSNIDHPNPTDHNGYCHHSYPPGYYSFRPPFSHVQPPPQLYYYGPYPPYPDAYSPNFIPPPHYSVDQARYDYAKARNHCCGCPNHTCHRREDSSPKIEEQKPEKVQDREFSGLIPLPKQPNYPYPIMWVPPSYVKGEDNDKASELQPGCWNGWVPLDVNSLKGLRHEGEEKKSQQGEDKRTQSPFPIIWMPGYDKSGEAIKDLKEINAMPKAAEEWPSKFKIIPLKLLENEGRGEKRGVIEDELKNQVQSSYDKLGEAGKDLKEINAMPKAAEERPSKFNFIPLKLLENGGRGGKLGVVEDELKNQVQPEAAVEKETRTKTIPVKHLEEKNEKQLSMPQKPEEKVDEKKPIISEKKEESEVKAASEKKQSSPVRSSKLPPVCLRVDPLPRRKTSNDTSRSPSPPGLKKGRAHQHNEEQRPTKETREEIPTKEIPVIDMKDKSSSQAEKDQKCQDDVPVASLKDSSGRAVVGEVYKSEDSLKAKEVKSKNVEVLEGSEGEGKEDSGEGKSAEGEQKIEMNRGHVQASESKKMEEKNERRRDLSLSDAAVIIQSAFRGFEVRRWQPVEKLRKIVRIREQVGHITRQIQSIEASSKELDAKERVVIGETIMNLLLQLDTIQGLHPSVREVRKSVARELICLQEKLDTLGSQVTEEQKSVEVEESPTKKNSDDQAACFISSCLEAKPTSEQESSKDKLDSVGSTATEEPARVEEILTDRCPDKEVAFIASPSLVTQLASVQESMQPADENGVAEQPSFENKKSDRFPAEVAAIVASPSLANETASEQETMQSANECGVAEKPSFEEAGSDQERREEREPGDFEALECVEKDSEEPLSLLKDEAVSSMYEEAPPVYAGEQVIQSISEDVVPDLGVEELPEPVWDIKCQELEAVDEEEVDSGTASDTKAYLELQKPSVQSLEEGSNLVEAALVKAEELELVSDARGSTVFPPGEGKTDSELATTLEQGEEAHAEQEKLQVLPLAEGSGPMEKSARDGDVDTPSSDMSYPECIIEGDSVERITVENQEATASEIRSPGVSECGKEYVLKVTNEAIEGEHTLLSASGTLQETTIDKVADASASTQEISAVVINEKSSPGPVSEATTEEADAPASKEECSTLALLEGLPSVNGLSSTMNMSKEEKQLIEENEKLREMLETLLEAGKEQLGVMSNLNGRVKDLERKLSQKKRVKAKKHRPAKLRARKVAS